MVSVSSICRKVLFAFVNNNELTDLEKNSAEAGFEIGVMAFPAPEAARLPCFTTLVLTDSWFTPVPSIRNSPQGFFKIYPQAKRYSRNSVTGHCL